MGGKSSKAPVRKSQKSGYYCDEAKMLLDRFGLAVEALLLLHEEQFLSVIRGNNCATRFDILIHGANAKKQRAKNAYMRHLEQHGCSLSREIEYVLVGMSSNRLAS